MEIVNLKELLTWNQEKLAQCEKELKYLTNSREYGCMLTNCPWIVINKERLMCVTVNDEHRTDYEFSPLNPTHFSRETANMIINKDIYKDINGNKIPLEAIGDLEYYQILRDTLLKRISSIQELIIHQEQK